MDETRGKRHLSAEVVETVRQLVNGPFASVNVGEGNEAVHILRTSLPDHLILGVVRQEDGLWIVMDSDRADVRKHLGQLLEHWPAEVCDPEVAEIADALRTSNGPSRE